MTIDAERRVALVTGASSGIGKSTAVKLAARGWQVIGVGRDPERSAAAEAEIAAAAPAGGFCMVRADFTLMAEVKRVADEVGGRTGYIDVLVNNAGGVRDRQYITAEGTEATFAANHLAPFLLTRELMPLLKASAASRPSGTTRVIAVSSTAHRMIDALDFDDLQSLGGFQPAFAYGRAKLANILFTRELARRAEPEGIVAQVMHPGLVASNFASHGDEGMRTYMASAAAVSPDEPAETLAWLATEPAGGHPGGRYFYQQAEETPSAAAQDDAAARRLWAESETLLAKLGF
ncbi:SDR family NAD(P)-dependent oxidoreductase [Trebonia kvetii]|uniref:SDR family NAD(P)-dependent oxidoreductase n=1 Tax=Trebonia kvetii TaxID=2480626 RepID=UPI001C9E8EBA|nr:SDR family NAD(P)-dependent oxidoreductase [Trebonia kvetii]